MKMTMLNRPRGIKLQEESNISKQIKELNKNGIYPVEVRLKAKMIVVAHDDLDRASRLKIFPDITIARAF